MEAVFAGKKDAKTGAGRRGEARQRDPAQVRGRQQVSSKLRRAVEKRVVFRSAWLPYALVAPQIAITIVFFFWPAVQAVWYSFQLQDAFGAADRSSSGCRTSPQLFSDAQLPRLVQGHGGLQRAGRRASASRSRCCSPTMADRVHARRARLQDAADLALRGGARGRRRAVGVPVRALDRHRHLRPAQRSASTGTGSQRRPGDAAGGDRLGLEADQLQLPVLPRRAAVDPELADRGGGDRRRRARRGASGPSCSRCSRPPPSSCWWSTSSTRSSTPSA